MYELFVLGELLDQPLHGYLLREIINLAFGAERQISWGSLYPLIRRLEEGGFISHAADASGKARRKSYAITEKGRQRFFNLMLRPEAFSSDYHDMFVVKLANFDRISPEQRVGILVHYQSYLEQKRDRLEESERFVARLEGIPEAERGLILRGIGRNRELNRAERTWLDGQLADFSEDL